MDDKDERDRAIVLARISGWWQYSIVGDDEGVGDVTMRNADGKVIWKETFEFPNPHPHMPLDKVLAELGLGIVGDMLDEIIPARTARINTVKGHMESLGKSGKHVMLRYDPDRAKDNWTVVVDGKRIGDGDDPAKLLHSARITQEDVEWAEDAIDELEIHGLMAIDYRGAHGKTCPVCDEKQYGGSHYHCPRCTGVTGMYGHWSDGTKSYSCEEINDG